ncbi:putative pyridoxal phosphate-dependent aminotransferase EpsN [compost metagenome]
MCPVLLKAAIEDRIKQGKKPKAIIPVHLYGMPAKMDEIIAIANEYEIPVIEDAAEALGSTLNGKPMGTFGLMGILSFNGNKIITTSGGGALVSDVESYIKKSRFLATQARDEAPHYQHSEIGYNYRMSNVCAAIGRGQMEVLNDRVAQRRANFERYKAFFSFYKGISCLDEPEGFYSNRWLSTILVNPELAGGVTREIIAENLALDNIESRPLWKPMHLQPVFANSPFYGDGTSEALFKDGLCLPSGSNLTTADIDRVLDNIAKTLR